MKTLKFYKCKVCGNVIVKLVDKEVPLFCCGEKMDELCANTVEASTEKHLPVVDIKNKLATIKVGSVPHPMEEGHFINFVALQTNSNYIIKSLKPGSLPQVELYIGNEKIIAVYEYCNLHGLWKTEIE